MQKKALFTSSVIFLVFALAHILRYLFNIQVTIGRVTIPVFLSLVIAMIAAVLGVWMLILSKKQRDKS